MMISRWRIAHSKAEREQLLRSTCHDGDLICPLIKAALPFLSVGFGAEQTNFSNLRSARNMTDQNINIMKMLITLKIGIVVEMAMEQTVTLRQP